MKKILNKIGQVLQVVLVAPVKLPAKTVSFLKYVAMGLGILETVLEEEKKGSDPAQTVLPAETALKERRDHDETE